MFCLHFLSLWKLWMNIVRIHKCKISLLQIAYLIVSVGCYRLSLCRMANFSGIEKTGEHIYLRCSWNGELLHVIIHVPWDFKYFWTNIYLAPSSCSNSWKALPRALVSFRNATSYQRKISVQVENHFHLLAQSLHMMHIVVSRRNCVRCSLQHFSLRFSFLGPYNTWKNIPTCTTGCNTKFYWKCHAS